jgi:8-oxo-dGTP pyrophosphatase MutT (NUDIX family)
MPISPYYASLRERIGNELLLLPTVAVLPLDDANRILLVRHAYSGQWATLGGAVEPDESPPTAAIREVEEEAGVVVELTRLLDSLGGPEYRVTYPNGDECACVVAVYAARVLQGDPRPDDDEVTEVRWFTQDEIPSLDVNPLNRAVLESVLPLTR